MIDARRLQGKTALVTGGGNGIGRAICLLFAHHGANIVVADIAEPAANGTVEAINSSGGEAVVQRLDAHSRDDNEAAMGFAVDRFHSLDIVVTCAAINKAKVLSTEHERDAFIGSDPVSDFISLEEAEWTTVIDVNLTGTFYAIQCAARHMQKCGGSIITISSIAAKTPYGGRLPYCVSKSGVWMLTQWAANALVSAGIRVNSIAPGIIDTNFTRILKEAPDLAERAINQIPMKRLGEPEEIANAALFLASDEASYITGEMLQVHGGCFTG